MTDHFDGGGNFYNKYESRNPAVQMLMSKYFTDLDSMIYPIQQEVRSALDIGCGEGYTTKHIQDLGIHIEGADDSERIIKTAKRLHPSVPYSVYSIYDLHSLNQRYDLVVANEVLEHLENPERALSEMKCISNKYIFVSVPHEPFFRLANMVRCKYLSDWGNTPGHINHWSRKSFRAFLEASSLHITNIKCSSLWLMALCQK